MKKLGNLIKISFLLVVGATFSTQINSAIDWIAAVDYTALGANIELIAGKIADAAVYVYDFVVGLFEATGAEAAEAGTGTLNQ